MEYQDRSGGDGKKMMTKLRRNAKALSPIFAVLILIAIAVIAGIVVYMFTSGTIASMTGGGTAGQEKAAIQGVDTATPVAWAQNTGGVDITITDYLIKNAAGNIVDQGTVTAPAGDLPTSGLLVDVPISLTGTTSGQSYTVTLVSSKGGSFVSSSFVAP
jgi:flagellin-like protein